MKTIVMDLDGTLTKDGPEEYSAKKPNIAVIEKCRQLKSEGYKIVINTARNMNSFGGNIGLINTYTLPTILAWLQENEVPFDEIHVGKPWCGTEGFYVDDRAIRPSEFRNLTIEQINKTLAKEQL